MNSSEDAASLHEEKYHSVVEGAKGRHSKSNSKKQQKEKRTARKSTSTSDVSASARKPSKSGKPDHFRNSLVHETYMESHIVGEAMQPEPAALEVDPGSSDKKRMDRFVEILLHMDVKGQFLLDTGDRKDEAPKHHLRNYQHHSPPGAFSSAAHSSPSIAAPRTAAVRGHGRKPSSTFRSHGSLPTEGSAPLVQPRVPQVFSQAPASASSHKSSPLGITLSSSTLLATSVFLPGRESSGSFQTAPSTMPHSVSLADTSEPSAEASVEPSGTIGGGSSDSALPSSALGSVAAGSSQPSSSIAQSSFRGSQDFVSTGGGAVFGAAGRSSSSLLSGRKSQRGSIGGALSAGVMGGGEVRSSSGLQRPAQPLGASRQSKHRRLDSVNSDCPSAVGEHLEPLLSASSGDTPPSAAACRSSSAHRQPAVPSAPPASTAAPCDDEAGARVAAAPPRPSGGPLGPSSSSSAPSTSRPAAAPAKPVSRPLFQMSTHNFFLPLMGCVSRDPSVLSRRAKKKQAKKAAAAPPPAPAPPPVSAPAVAASMPPPAAAAATLHAAEEQMGAQASSVAVGAAPEGRGAPVDTLACGKRGDDSGADQAPSAAPAAPDCPLSEAEGSDTAPVDTPSTSEAAPTAPPAPLSGGDVAEGAAHVSVTQSVVGVQLASVFENASASNAFSEDGWEKPKKRSGRKGPKDSKTPATVSSHLRNQSSGSVADSTSVLGSQKSGVAPCSDPRSVRISGGPLSPDPAPDQAALPPPHGPLPPSLAVDAARPLQHCFADPRVPLEPVATTAQPPLPPQMVFSAFTAPVATQSVFSAVTAPVATQAGSQVPVATASAAAPVFTGLATGVAVPLLPLVSAADASRPSWTDQLKAVSDIFSHPLQAEASTSSAVTTPSTARTTTFIPALRESRSRNTAPPVAATKSGRSTAPIGRRRSSSGSAAHKPSTPQYPGGRPASYSAAVTSSAPVATTPRSELTTAILENSSRDLSRSPSHQRRQAPSPVRTAPARLAGPLDPLSPAAAAAAASPKSPLSLPPASGSPTKQNPLSEPAMHALMPSAALGFSSAPAPASSNPPVHVAPSMHEIAARTLPQEPRMVATGVFTNPSGPLEVSLATGAPTSKLAPCGSSHSSDPGTPHAFCATNCPLTIAQGPSPAHALHIEGLNTNGMTSCRDSAAHATFPGAHAWRGADYEDAGATRGTSPFGSPMQTSALSAQPLMSSPGVFFSARRNGRSNSHSNSNRDDDANGNRGRHNGLRLGEVGRFSRSPTDRHTEDSNSHGHSNSSTPGNFHGSPTSISPSPRWRSSFCSARISEASAVSEGQVSSHASVAHTDSSERPDSLTHSWPSTCEGAAHGLDIFAAPQTHPTSHDPTSAPASGGPMVARAGPAAPAAAPKGQELKWSHVLKGLPNTAKQPPPQPAAAQGAQDAGPEGRLLAEPAGPAAPSAEGAPAATYKGSSLAPVATQGTSRMLYATSPAGMVLSPSVTVSDLSASASAPLGGLDRSGQFPWGTAQYSMSESQMSPTQISHSSAFLCTSPSAHTFTMEGSPSSDSNPIVGDSINAPPGMQRALGVAPEQPNQRIFNKVSEQMQHNMHVPYQLWTDSLRGVEEHVVALDLILQVVEASMLSAMNDEEGEDEMHCGNETLAAFMLHHCMHVNLAGYSKLSPFRHRTAQGQVVGGTDARTPYPSSKESADFYEEARFFTRMDISTMDALATLANLAQVEANTGEAPEDDATARPQAEKDHLAARLLYVSTTVLSKHVRKCLDDRDPEKALGAFQAVLKRLERFVALDGDPISLHCLGAGQPALHEFKLVFDPPDFQMRPPVVGCFVILLLSRLLEITRDMLCTAIDAFPPDSPYPEAQRACVQEVYSFWERLANMAKSVCEQIAERLLRKERVSQFATRFRPDGLSWSVVLQSANSHFVNGWDGPQSSKRGFKGGLLQHAPFALIDGARHSTPLTLVTCEGSIRSHPHLSDIANRSANDANSCILFIIHTQLSSVNGAFKTLKELLDPPNAHMPAKVDRAALEEMVEEFRTLRYDGHTRQLTLLVKNLSSFFDVVINIVRMIQDFEENRLLPPEAYMHSEAYSNLAGLLEDTFLNYMSAWGHTLQLFSIYFSRDFKWDASSKQFKEWCDRRRGFLARTRGVTRPTIASLESRVQTSIDLVRNLIHCKRVQAAAHADSMEDWPPTYQELPRMWIRCQHSLEMTLKDLLSQTDHSGDVDSMRSGVDHELSERQVRDVFYLDSARSTARTEPEMPTLDDLTNDLIQQRTLPTDERKVAPARSTLGTICKHVVYPRAQDRARLRPVPVAIKWIEVYAGASGSVAMPNGISSKERWRALCAEWGALLTVRNSLKRSHEGDSDVAPPTPAKVTLEEVNVVIGLALHGNGLSHDDVRALMARTPPPLEEVRVRKRVGIVFEWLPNGSLEDLLTYCRPASRTFPHASRNQLTPKLAISCQASRWPPPSSSSSSTGNNGANDGVNNGVNAAVRKRLPEDLANRPISEVMAMPCDAEAVASLGHDWIRAIIPPPAGEAGLPRYTLDKLPSALNLFSSRLGVFRSAVTFPACKEPLTDPEDPDAMFRIPSLFVFSFGWTLQLMLQLAKGVALCHRVGVVHHDLEPWNLMFDRFGRPKLIDFGFSRHMVDPGRGSVGRLDHVLYAAPECRIAVPDDPLPPEGTPVEEATPSHFSLDLPRTLEGHNATDVWTMGVVCWQMLTLQPATGLLLEATARLSILREKLVEDDLIQADVAEAASALEAMGMAQQHALQEAERVPPLPAARFVRPAVFPESHSADEANWYRDAPEGGYRRLRALVVQMLSVDARDRPSALQVAEALNDLVVEFRCML